MIAEHYWCLFGITEIPESHFCQPLNREFGDLIWWKFFVMHNCWRGRWPDNDWHPASHATRSPNRWVPVSLYTRMTFDRISSKWFTTLLFSWYSSTKFQAHVTLRQIPCGTRVMATVVWAFPVWALAPPFLSCNSLNYIRLRCQPMSSGRQLAVHSTLGAVSVGFFASSVVFGVLTWQVFTYFRRYPSDKPAYKVLVSDVEFCGSRADTIWRLPPFGM